MPLEDLQLYGGFHLRDTACDVFQDNPLFSELIFSNPVEPTMRKTWQRYVAQTGQATPAHLPEYPGDISDWNRLERQWSRGRVSLESLWGGWQHIEPSFHLPWLIVCPRPETFHYWYGYDLDLWLNATIKLCERYNYPYRVRTKPDRKQRTLPQDRIIHNGQHYGGIITCHSVAQIDGLLAGRPVIVYGADATLGCATPYSEWIHTGECTVPIIDQIQTAACAWAATTYRSLDLKTIADHMKQHLRWAEVNK